MCLLLLLMLGSFLASHLIEFSFKICMIHIWGKIMHAVHLILLARVQVGCWIHFALQKFDVCFFTCFAQTTSSNDCTMKTTIYLYTFTPLPVWMTLTILILTGEPEEERKKTKHRKLYFSFLRGIN